jgi:hypothetical protein
MAIAVSKRIGLKDGTILRMHFLVPESGVGKLLIRIVAGKGNNAKRYEGNSFHTEGQYIVLGKHIPGDAQHLGTSEIIVVQRFGPLAADLKDSGTALPEPDVDMPAPGPVSCYVH